MPSEFSLIDKYFRPLASGFAPARELRDDAGYIVVPDGMELVVTKDLIVSGVHFIGDEPAHLIAQKALRVNLSDLAAKGATPYAYSLGLAMPTFDERWIADFARGLGEDQKRFGIRLMGGDTTQSKHDLVISITAYGFIPKGSQVLRSGAKSGDVIFVTGTIGDAGLGLKILRSPDLHGEGIKFLIDRYHLPQPRMDLIAALKQANAVNAVIDVSDGLLADLRHICVASGVGSVINLPQIPLSQAAKAFINQTGVRLADILAMGDDYEILFTADPKSMDKIASVAREFHFPAHKIGSIVPGEDIALLDKHQNALAIEKYGYEH